MNLILTAMVAGALMAAPVADKWELKPNLEPKAKASWAVKVAAQAPDGDHEAEFTLVREYGAKDGETQKATMGWSGLIVDGNELGQELTWDVSVNARAAVVGTIAEEGDDIRRMLSAMTFTYPDKPVGEGDKWSLEIRPYTGKDDFMLTYAYEVKGVESVDSVDALKITLKLTEKDQYGMTGEGTWWVGKDGSVLKFEMKMKNWVVPMAGEPFDATIIGKKG